MFKRFGYAFKGLHVVLYTQQNFRIHLGILIAVVAAGFWLKISLAEWCVVCCASVAVLALETMNTAIEKLVDLVSPQFNKEAGIIKDLAAGAVLIAAIGAVLAGIIIFLPKLIQIVKPSYP